jgi:hypothetical protein
MTSPEVLLNHAPMVSGPDAVAHDVDPGLDEDEADHAECREAG